MKTSFNFIKVTLVPVILVVLLTMVASCGSYQIASYYETDGAYSSQYAQATSSDRQSGKDYTQVFRSMDYYSDNEVFTDVDTYQSYNDTLPSNVTYNSNGWGDNTNTVSITINSGWGRPYGYYNYWNSPYNNWYNGWGFNNYFYNDYFYWNNWNSWNNWNWGYPYVGYYGYNSPYYGYYGNYYGGYHNHYYGKNVSYANGRRGGNTYYNTTSNRNGAPNNGINTNNNTRRSYGRTAESVNNSVAPQGNYQSNGVRRTYSGAINNNQAPQNRVYQNSNQQNSSGNYEEISRPTRARYTAPNNTENNTSRNYQNKETPIRRETPSENRSTPNFSRSTPSSSGGGNFGGGRSSGGRRG